MVILPVLPLSVWLSLWIPDTSLSANPWDTEQGNWSAMGHTQFLEGQESLTLFKAIPAPQVSLDLPGQAPPRATPR